MDEINKRVRQLIEAKGYTYVKFANELGVIRSGISHVVSGRNKPGVELLQKILSGFPDVNPYWLLLGSGSMFKDLSDADSGGDASEEQAPEGGSPGDDPLTHMNTGEEDVPDYGINRERNIDTNKSVKRIILFFDDHSYQDFYPPGKEH